tara:strand:- start:2119 stop:2364 length:246 start_codon:yes stop_codon:yes gene_type:complete
MMVTIDSPDKKIWVLSEVLRAQEQVTIRLNEIVVQNLDDAVLLENVENALYTSTMMEEFLVAVIEGEEDFHEVTEEFCKLN